MCSSLHFDPNSASAMHVSKSIVVVVTNIVLSLKSENMGVGGLENNSINRSQVPSRIRRKLCTFFILLVVQFF